MRYAKRKQIIWDAIRAVSATKRTDDDIHPIFTVPDLEEQVWQDQEIRLNTRVYRRYLNGLTVYGCLERLVDGKLATGEWKLVRDEGKKAPYVNEKGKPIGYGLVRQQLWQAIRILKKFDTKDLRIHASTEECNVEQQEANKYVTYLLKAKVLVKVGKKAPKSRQLVQLVPSRNTGPRPPVIEERKVITVLDGNTGEVLYIDEGRGDE